MKNSILRENIILQTADYKCVKQNEILRRFVFRSKKGEDDTPLPYTLLTKKVSSHFFKRNINQQVKLIILNAEYMGINVSDILYKLKTHRISEINENENIRINDHYPLDTKINTIDFFKMTNKFINVYQILSDGSIKKINPLSQYLYNGQRVGLTITINGSNCISIEFYDDGKSTDYMIEIMGCVISYEQMSYEDFIGNKYDYRNDIISYVDGSMIYPTLINKTNYNIEVFILYEKNIIFNGIKYINNYNSNDYFNFVTNPGYISGKLITHYGSIINGETKWIMSSDNITYTDNDFYQYVPNIFKVNKIDKNESARYLLILGDVNTALKGDHISIDNDMLNIYDYNIDSANTVLKDLLENKDKDSRLLLSYPHFYREVLEKKIEKELYINTIHYIKINQKVKVNNKWYIKFSFPIKSFSFMLFLKGKIITPDIYEENKLDINIYILAEKIIDGPLDVVLDENHDQLSNYTHNQLSLLKHMDFERNDKEFYHGPVDRLKLIDPITIIRCKNFFSESNRFPVDLVDIYLDKKRYRNQRYTKYEDTNRYVIDDNGLYIKYNDRFYSIVENDEYVWDYTNKKYKKVGTDGDFYHIIENKVKVPYNKHLEEEPYNLYFMKNTSHICNYCHNRYSEKIEVCPVCNSADISEEKYLVELSDTTLDRIQANSRYQFKQDIAHPNKYNEILNAYPKTTDDHISIYDADVGYSRYHTSIGNNDGEEYDIPEEISNNHDQIMVFANGYHIDDYVLNTPKSIITIPGYIKGDRSLMNDIFICNASKMMLYQTIENLTLYSHMTIELDDILNDTIDKNYEYRNMYRRKIDMVHTPLSLKYMMIFVNGLYMDNEHVEILSNRRFMLKNLQDFPEIKTKRLKEVHTENPELRHDQDVYVINSIDIYMYPFNYDSAYEDYYNNKITYYDDNNSMTHYEYPINDSAYNELMSSYVAHAHQYCDKVIFEGENIKEQKRYYVSDFRHIDLNKFDHDELTEFRHTRTNFGTDMSEYTHYELSGYNHDQLSKFTHNKTN